MKFSLLISITESQVIKEVNITVIQTEYDFSGKVQMKLQIIFLEILRKLKTKNKSDKIQEMFPVADICSSITVFLWLSSAGFMFVSISFISPEQSRGMPVKKTKCNENLSKDCELQSCGLEARDIKKLDNKINLLNSTKGGFHLISAKVRPFKGRFWSFLV